MLTQSRTHSKHSQLKAVGALAHSLLLGACGTTTRTRSAPAHPGWTPSPPAAAAAAAAAVDPRRGLKSEPIDIPSRSLSFGGAASASAVSAVSTVSAAVAAVSALPLGFAKQEPGHLRASGALLAAPSSSSSSSSNKRVAPPSPSPASGALRRKSGNAGWSRTPSPSPTRADLGRAVRLAAQKNAEIKRNPKRANSLSQTLLQRRLWFALMDSLQESRAARPAPSGPPPRRSTVVGRPAR